MASHDAARMKQMGEATGSRNSPHLIDYQGAKRCSICKMPFPPDAPPSLDEAFSEHVLKAHRPGQTSEDFSQAAFRAVKEATDKV
jgi:hypothetical protein